MPDARPGRRHEDVTLTTSDGLELEGWYVPSRNGAAVIAFPGRKNPQPHTRMLVEHGYGVLLFDRAARAPATATATMSGWGGARGTSTPPWTSSRTGRTSIPTASAVSASRSAAR